MEINERLDALQERLRLLEDKLRRQERRLRRHSFLRGEQNMPRPVLTQDEKAYIRAASGFDSDPVRNDAAFETYRSAALDILSWAVAAELDVGDRQCAEVIQKSLQSAVPFTAKQAVYVTTQIIRILTGCIARLPAQRHKGAQAALARLEELVDFEEQSLPF